MSIGQLLLGVWLILVGIDWAGWASFDSKFLGIFAVVTGIVVLLEGAGVVNRKIG